METKNIEQIWKSGKASTEEQLVPDLETVRRLSRKNIGRTRVVMLVYSAVYLLMLFATIVLEVINFAGYRGNAGMLAIHAAITTLAVLFSIYGIFLTHRILALERAATDLVGSLRQRIRFYRIHYEIWLWIVAITIILLTFAINSLVDNDQGHYRINNLTLYISLEAGILIFVYIMMKVAHYPLLKGMMNHLSDLERQTTESTDRFEKRKNRWRWWALAGLILIMGFLAWIAIGGLLSYS